MAATAPANARSIAQFPSVDAAFDWLSVCRIAVPSSPKSVSWEIERVRCFMNPKFDKKTALFFPSGMDLDKDKIDDTVLALLSLSLHADNRAWKGFDWDAMERLYAKGLISNPVGKARSVTLTDEGLQKSEHLLLELFGTA